VQAGKTPPQHTPLGGYIGIHGVGSGDPEVHRAYNWTNGCVALTNAQIDILAEWARAGTPVEIR
jgi:lipoprotein-anchoring transpeptidase ErfK/SrfK